MSDSTEHSWFSDQIAAYIARALASEDVERFESHARECETCAKELNAARELENKMSSLFAATFPARNFEDRLIARLRETAPRLRINPAVRRAAIAAAALLFVGSVGYVANQQMSRGTLPGLALLSRVQTASNLRQIGQSILMYANENKGAYPAFDAELFTAPSSNAEKWDFSGGANSTVNWSDWTKNDRSLRLKYGDQFATRQPSAGAALGGRGTLDVNGLAPGGRVSGNAIDEVRALETKLGDAVAGVPVAPSNAPEPELERVDVSKQVRDFDGTKLGVDYYFSPQNFARGVAVPGLEGAAGGDVKLGLPLQAAADKKEIAAKLVVAGKTEVAFEQVAQQLADKPAPPPVAGQQQQQPPPVSAVNSRKVIRNGELEFEVESFDNTLVNITKITAEEGGFVATTNSQKLPNGKVKGEVVVRVAPDHLDVLVLKLRALGDLKRQNLVAQDITKQYTDLDSQLRAAKAMQERLLEMIKSGQGAIKDLLAAEKELGVWREKIEKIEGEMRYYDSQVALSTLSISAYEKDVKSAAAAKQSEQADVGIEAEDVEQARADAIKAIDDAKGRIIESELKQFDAGQLAAKIVADVSPDNAGAVIDRLKQLGKVARLEINRKQTSVDGQSPPVPGAKVERGDTRLVVSLYNIANIAPRQTTNLTVACANVEEAYAKIVELVGKANGRIVTSNINRDRPQLANAVVQFEVKTADAEPALAALKSAGEAMRLTMSENPDSNNVTSAKRGFSLQLVSMDQVAPREMNQRELATEDVEKSYRAITSALAQTKSRVMTSKMETPGGGAPANAYLDFEVRRTDVGAIDAAIASAGDSYNRNISTSQDAENTSASKLRYVIQMHNVAILAPKQTTTLAVEVKDVDRAITDLTSSVTGIGGRVVDSTRSKEANGRTIARVMLDVPFKSAAEMTDKARGLGVVRAEQVAGSEQAPGGALARARFAITVASPDAIVSSDKGIWATIRNGLSTSMVGLMWSLQLIVIGVCLIAPWVIAIVLGWKLVRWSRRDMPAKAGTPSA